MFNFKKTAATLKKERRGRNKFLTPKETEALAWLEHGMSNKEIAQRMKVKDRTVRNYLLNASAKSGVYGRFNLILWIFSGKWRELYRKNKYG